MPSFRYIQMLLVTLTVSQFHWCLAEYTYRFDHGVDLDTDRPLVIAHRGLAGVYPEHTTLAYQRAIDMGTDVIECDVCLTKDLKLVCLHESWLSLTTDVADHPEFADRQRNDLVGGVPVLNDWFSVDFTLDELRTLRVRQRRGGRDPTFDWQYGIVSVGEYIEIAQNASRKIGVYPETKDPGWVNNLDIVIESGKRFEDFLLEELGRYGYSEATDPAFIQSFSGESVQYMSTQTKLPLVRLLIPVGQTSDDDLLAWSEYCYGIGAHRQMVVNHHTVMNGAKNWIIEVTDLVERAHAVGLRVHPYTFHNEDENLAWDYMQDPSHEYLKYYSIGVDGYFTDFAHTLKQFLDATYAGKEPVPSNAAHSGLLLGSPLHVSINTTGWIIILTIYGL